MHKLHRLTVQAGAVLQKVVITIPLCQECRPERSDSLVQDGAFPNESGECILQLEAPHALPVADAGSGGEKLDKVGDELGSYPGSHIEARDIRLHLDRASCLGHLALVFGFLSRPQGQCIRVFGPIVNEDAASLISCTCVAIFQTSHALGPGLIALDRDQSCIQ